MLPRFKDSLKAMGTAFDGEEIYESGEEHHMRAARLENIRVAEEVQRFDLHPELHMMRFFRS